MVTVAFGTTAPLWSATTPRSVAVCAHNEPVKKANRISLKDPRFDIVARAASGTVYGINLRIP
jgi:hypothetical protein